MGRPRGYAEGPLEVRRGHPEDLGQHSPAADDGVGLTFADGCRGVVPFAELPEVGARPGVSALELPNPCEVVLTTSPGEPVSFPGTSPATAATAPAGRRQRRWPSREDGPWGSAYAVSGSRPGSPTGSWPGPRAAAGSPWPPPVSCFSNEPPPPALQDAGAGLWLTPAPDQGPGRLPAASRKPLSPILGCPSGSSGTL